MSENFDTQPQGTADAAPIQETLFDVGPSDEVGYRVPIALSLIHI